MKLSYVLIVSFIVLFALFFVFRSADASSFTPIQTVLQTDSISARSELSSSLPIIPQAPGEIADLSVSVVDAPDPALVSRSLTYTVTVVNNTVTVTVTNVVVTNTLSGAFTFVSATPLQGSCTGTSQVVCNLGSIRGSGNTRVVIVVTPTSAGTVSNAAQVRSVETDPAPGNNTASASTTVNPLADLGLSISDAPDPATAGSALAYTLNVTNNGPSNATGVVVTDTLPTNTTYQSFTGTGWNCATVSGGRVRCTLATLNASASSSVTLNLLVSSAASGSLTNTAVVSSSAADLTSANNTDSETTAVITSANLGVTVSDSPDPVNAGATLSYVVTVSNAGPSNAAGVVFTDTLAASLAYQSFTGSGWSCTLLGTQLRCTLTGSLAAGGSSLVTIITRVNSSTPAGSLSNSVIVRSATSDPASGNNTASATTTVQTSADLRINKVDSVDPVSPGTSMAYTIFITNTGPSDAAGVRITDTLPGSVSYITHVPSSDWACSLVSGSLRCSRTTPITANASIQLALVVSVDINASGTLSNQVRVGATTPDPLTTNNTDTETTLVQPSSDLSITKTGPPSSVIAGTNLTYTLTVSNNLGPSNAANVVVTDTLPTNVTYQSFGGSSGWSCTLLSGNRLRCTRASLNIYNSATLTILTRVNPGVSGSISNTATVSSASTDPVLANNSATVSTTIIQRADLSLTKTDSPDPVPEGQTLTYRLVVRNNGPSNAASVSLQDALPTARVTFVSAVAVPQGTCTWSSPNVTCSLGSVVSGNTVTVTVTTTAKPVGDSLPKTASNTATVSTTTTDPNTTNNTQTITTQVVPVGDLRLNLESLVTQVQTGNPLTYTLWITNTGPSIATNVVVTDTLPAELTYQSSTRPPAATAPKVVWNLGDLGVGQAVSFSLVVNVKSRTQALINSALVRSATVDVVPANSQDQTNVQAIDSVAPTANWKLPVEAEQMYITGPRLLTLEVEADDNVGVAYVRFKRWDTVINEWVEIGDDTTPETCLTNSARLCYHWNLDTRVLHPGWNEIKTRAYDASDNASPDGYRILVRYLNQLVFLPLARK